MTTKQLDKYKKLGWEFYLAEEWYNEREWAIKFKSPRMDRYCSLHWSKLGGAFEEFWEKVDEKDLLQFEAISYASKFVDQIKYSLECKIRDAILAGEKQITIEIK